MPQSNGVQICPTCSHENPGDARRCTNCDKLLAVVVKTPGPPPTTTSPARHKKNLLVLIALVLALVTASLLVTIAFNLTNTHSSPSSSIGVNDGSFAPFDIGRQDQLLKQQAAHALAGRNSSAAISLWHQALTVESNDAEALIYIEDQRILASGEPHITLIAGVAFTPPFPDGSSESDLQGIYVAQREFNTAQHGFQIRVLIANSGDNAPDTTTVAQQIVHIAQKDPTIVGVIGWRYSSYSLLAIPVLASAKIPLISPQSTSDELTGISQYFFRVVAPNSEEVQIAAPFIEKTLGLKHPVIFFDPQDSYSQNLAQGFIDQFSKDGHKNIYEEKFITNDKNPQEKFAALIQDAEKHNPDGFIFTSRSNDDTGSFQDALPTSGPWATLKVIAGSASYTAHPHSHGRWYIVAVAYHNGSNTSVAQKFQQEYSADFNTHAQKSGGYYGYTLADDHAMVAYDATALTLQALLNTGKTQPTRQDLASALPKITGANAFHGVSGQISFGSNGNPINKTLFILFVPLSGRIQQIAVCSIKIGCQ